MLKRSEFARNSIVLIVGTGLSQLIPLSIQPIIRRIFTDEEFGMFAQYFSIVSILSIVANLKYSNGIVLPKEDKSAINLLAGSILLNVAFSLLVFVILFFFGIWFFDVLGFSQNLIHYFYLIPISVFLVSTNLAFNYWLTRKKKFKAVALNKACRRAAEGAGRIGLGKTISSGGLFYGTLIGDFFNSILFYFQFRRTKSSFKGVTASGIKQVFREQIEFPKYALFPALLNVISTFLPVFLLSSLYDKSIVGQYDGSREILAVPLALISVSISQVLYQKVVEDDQNNASILRLMRNLTLILLACGLIGIAIFYPFGVDIFEFIYGDQWTLSGQLSSILVFSYAIRFIVSPLSIIFVALKKLKISATWQTAYFLLMLNLLWFDDLTVQEFLTYFVIFDVIAYLIYGFLIYRLVLSQNKSK